MLSQLAFPPAFLESSVTATNPLLTEWTTPFGLPPFHDFAADHYRPAFEAALNEARAAFDAIAADPASPTFTNTIDAMERAEKRLDRVAGVFFNLVSTNSDAALEEIQREMAPKLAQHSSQTLMNPALFERVDTLMQTRTSLGLTSEQDRVLELYHRMFVRAGAQLTGAERDRMSAIMSRLATLGTQFTQNLLADEREWFLVLQAEEDLAGLPEFLRDAAASAAAERNLDGKHVVTLSRSLIEPFLQFSTRRDLRETAFKAWTARGENGSETDNREIIAETLNLRAERAKLLGFEDFASYKLAPQMAKTPLAVRELLLRVWAPAKARAGQEAEKLEALLRQDGGNYDLAPWDWRFYAEKQRKIEHDFDEAELKPYLPLDRMLDAAFETAHRLFGLSFSPIENAPLPHPDARAWEVRRGNEHVGVFIGDYFARPSKRSGAWMSAFRSQQKLDGEVRPIVVNVMNFAKARPGEPTLLTFDDARTLFHEFGHALHGLLSDVTYPHISGTSVARDFVELPSQLYEHWLSEPAILSEFARHYKTGAPIPADLLEKVRAAETFNQGFATVEYLSSALVDLEMHTGDPAPDPMAKEAEVLSTISMPEAIVMRHRSPQFAHVFSGDGYSAGYYSYMWSEVMDADAFKAFEEAGDVFDPATAARLSEHIYSAGGKQDPEAAYVAFRGALPGVEALLEQRGLDQAA